MNFISTLIDIVFMGLAFFAGMVVYDWTSRRKKTQKRDPEIINER